MAKIVVDAGHGGNDPGASGNGIIEKEYTLKISQYIYDRLKSLGLDVKMTRETLVKIERGVQHIQLEQLKAIKTVLGVSYEDLLD